MKKIQMLVMLAFLLMSTAISGQNKVKAYFTTTEMPDMLKFAPTPPDSTSSQFQYDMMRYEWGKAQRQDSVRAAIAIRDAVYGLKTIINEFSEPFGLQISEEDTPKIYYLLKVGLASTDSICTIPKRHYMRMRPFMKMKEPTLTPWDEASLSRNGSFPSGHTILGWSAALLLSEINPERADTLLARGLMYGESRVIVGAHWQSDVDAGVLAASVAYGKLHTSKRFQKDMKRARKEFHEIMRKRER